MDFVQAHAQLAELTAKLRQGRISPGDFAEAVNRLQVRDAAGYVWQPDPAGTGWLYWDGAQWRPGSAPHQAPGEAGRQTPPPALRTASQPGTRAQLLSPERFGDITRNVPLERRPQAWWDVLSLWAGAACGYFWLVYSLVRGMPRIRALGNIGNSWLDLLPSLALLCLPVLLFIFRQAAMPALSRFFNGLRQMPLGRKLGWAALVAIIIAFLQTSNPILIQREGLDLITPLLMFAIPLGLVWFRSETDRMLLPLQAVLQPIPRLVLTVIGLGAPFLLGFILYNGFNISQYALLRWNVALGMLLSYAILRTPEGARSNRPQARYSAGAAVFLGAAYVLYDILARAHPAHANDFLTDPLNLNDGLRTSGIAPVLSGGASGTNTLFVNGVEVVRNTKGGKPRPGDPQVERTGENWGGRGRIVSGSKAVDWLKQNGMLDADGHINDKFRGWLNQLPGDPNTTDLEGVCGEFKRDDTGPLGDQITIILRDPDQPGGPDPSVHPQTDREDLAQQPTEEPQPQDEHGSGANPPDESEGEKPEVPEEREGGEPDDKKGDESAEPGPAGQRPEEPPTTPEDDNSKQKKEEPISLTSEAWKRLQELMKLLRGTSEGGIPGSIAGSAGLSLDDPGKYIDKAAKWLLERAKDLSPRYKKYVEGVQRTYEVHDHDKLPQNLRERGLFDASRESPLSQGMQQAMRNAGAPPEYIEAVARKIEADDSQRKRIAELGYEVLKQYRAAQSGAGTAVEVGSKLGVKEGLKVAAASAAVDYLPPDPTDFVKDLCVAQRSRYNDAVNAWRSSQSAGRFASTGLGVDNPTSAQDVDKVLRGLQADQRAIKNELGNDMSRMRGDPRMRDLWAEEQTLRNLRNQTADLNVLERGAQHK